MITLKLWQFITMNFITVSVGTFVGAMLAGGFLIRRLDIARLSEAIKDNEELINYLEKEREEIQDEIDELDDDEIDDDNEVITADEEEK